jgi:hypothetical protein
MPELLVASDPIDLIPAVRLQQLDYVPAVHLSSRYLSRYNTHLIHTCQHQEIHILTHSSLIRQKTGNSYYGLICAGKFFLSQRAWHWCYGDGACRYLSKPNHQRLTWFGRCATLQKASPFREEQ